jgi:very-short-patch-repair endonuclease
MNVPNELARSLRNRLTPQEIKLWVKLRELKSLGFHFRRQAPVGACIVDFISFRSRLVIEADGGQHGMPDGVRSDRARDEFLRSRGFRILRFWSSEIDQNLNGVMERTLSVLNTSNAGESRRPDSEVRPSLLHKAGDRTRLTPTRPAFRPATLPTRGRDKEEARRVWQPTLHPPPA